jgi:hypothetical protein
MARLSLALDPTLLQEDIAMVCNQGFDVNDDDKPVPENIPSPDAPLPVSNRLYEGQTWGWD